MRFLLLIVLALPLCADPVHDAISRFQGTVSVYAKNLDTGKTYGIREDERVRTASTIKLPLMVALFAAVQSGKLKWTDEVLLSDRDVVSGSGVLTELSAGIKLPIRDVMHLMIVVSDNTATNLAVDRIGADAVNIEMDKLGLKQTRLLRKVRGDGNQLKAPSGFSAAGKQADNVRFGLGVTTPREMVMLLEKIEKGEVVSAAASKEMIEVLKRQQSVDGMRRNLTYEVANKTGALDALRSDVGIVYTLKGRIALAITCDDMPKIDYGPDNPGALLIAELTKIISDELTRP